MPKRRQYKYEGKKTNIQIKGEIAKELGKINGYPIRWDAISTEKKLKRNYGEYEEKVKGFRLLFAIEDQRGNVGRYEILSQNGYDTVTNIYLIYKNIKQRVVDIENGVTSVDGGFNDLKLLPVEVDSDPYKILGVSIDTPITEIKRIYLELVKLYHPDRAGKEFEATFRAIQRAWEEIKREHGNNV